MTGPYMGSTGDQFAGADPRELERLRAELRVEREHADGLQADLTRLQATIYHEANALRTRVGQLEAEVKRKREALDAMDERDERWRARVEQLEQALREVLSAYDDDRQTWKQRAAQMMLFVEVALHPDRRETCTCKVRVGAAGEQGQRLSDGCPVHPDQRETT